jgi:hypothetical protein
MKKKSKAIPVTGRGDLWGCGMLRIPQCLDNQIMDGGKVVSPTHQLLFTPRTLFFYVSRTHLSKNKCTLTENPKSEVR